MKIIKIALIFCAVLFLFKSNAQSWQKIPAGTQKNLHNMFFLDEETGYIGGWHGILLSTKDGAKNIEHLPHVVAYYAASLYFHNPDTGYFVSSKGVIMKTTNAGEEWLSATDGQYSGKTHFYDIYFPNERVAYVVGGFGERVNGKYNKAYIVKSTDHGESWQSILNTEVNEVLTTVHFVNQDTGWVAGTGGIILKTTDGGANWSRQNSGTANEIMRIRFYDDMRGWACGRNGTILFTENGGHTWNTAYVNTLTHNLNSFDFTDSLNLFAVGDSGTYIRSTDGGRNWFPETVPSKVQLDKIVVFKSGTAYISGWKGTLLKTTNLLNASAHRLTMTHPKSGISLDNRVLEIKWENNLIDSLVLEYSEDNTNWKLIAAVAAQQKSYVWEVPANVKQFHVRIKNAENINIASGTTSWIKIIEKGPGAINSPATGSQFSIFPNPVGADISLTVKNESASIQSVIVFDSKGSKVFTESFSGSPTEVKIGAQELRQGLYILHIQYSDVEDEKGEIKNGSYLFMK